MVEDGATGTTTLQDFTAQTGIEVRYREDVNDNEEYFARIREPLSRGDDVGADMFIVTDFLVNRLIGEERVIATEVAGPAARG